MKKEKVTVQVEYEIEYDETKPNARKNVISLLDPHQTSCGENRTFGYYRFAITNVKRPK